MLHPNQCWQVGPACMAKLKGQVPVLMSQKTQINGHLWELAQEPNSGTSSLLLDLEPKLSKETLEHIFQVFLSKKFEFFRKVGNMQLNSGPIFKLGPTLGTVCMELDSDPTFELS